ncbi:MAG: AIM24 family protein [Pirellulales bacterium]|nr:AIM24 family protein [Pirellulales bacterium]
MRSCRRPATIRFQAWAVDALTADKPSRFRSTLLGKSAVPHRLEGGGTSVSRYSIEEFVEKTAQRDRGQGLFELENDRVLEINLNGTVWTKMGSMIAYRGQVKFKREGVLEHGVGRLLKRMVSGEGARLTKAEGRGKIYLADGGKKISIIELTSDAIVVNGNDLLAFEPVIGWDIKMMRKMTAMVAGGLFNVRLEGSGMVAITTHHDPLTLRVQPGQPVSTDPNATVAWSGNLSPEFKTDISFKTFVGRGSGESIQMHFDGDGFVVVQPAEELTFQQAPA